MLRMSVVAARVSQSDRVAPQLGVPSLFKMTFIDPDGTRHEVDAPEGLSVLEVAHLRGFDLEGACEGSMACSTCHVIVDPAWADKLPDASEEEEDMLDLAFNVRPTSRLGCQLTISQDFDGLVVSLPAQHYNLMGG